MRAARWFTALWGFAGIAFALLAGFAENLIEAVNIVGSIFYGVVLGIFLVAFFLRRVGGSAVFFAAVAAQSLVITMFLSLNIGYLWYNLIGCAACIAFSMLLQTVLGPALPPIRAVRHERRADHCFWPAALRVLPRRFLVAKIRTARRLQAEMGGRDRVLLP